MDIDIVEDTLATIVERLQPLRPRKVIVFGSIARGDADRLSDIDIMVVAEEVAPRFVDRIAQAYDLIEGGYALDILIYTPDEYAGMREDGNVLIEHATTHGRVLYERPAA